MISTTDRGYFIGAVLFIGWTWAIWSCAEHWRANPTYSYGWIVPILVFAYAGRRLAISSAETVRRLTFALPIWFLVCLAVIATPSVFGLEFAREQVWHPMFVIWTIAFVPVVSTLVVCALLGGKKLLRAELFPVLFFLTAVPWPARFEQPITAWLMQAVAAATAGVLHCFGIPAQTAGGAITLRNGIIGITEACSGMRSLQAGMMFGLATGEWFLLPPLRRIALLLVSIVLAFGTNLTRTIALALQAEWNGISAVEQIHDFTGTSAVVLLLVAIWLSALLLRRSHRNTAPFAFEKFRGRLRAVGAAIPMTLERAALTILIAGILGITIAQIVSAKIEAYDQTQTAPFFFLCAGLSQTPVQLPHDVWDELHPTSGECIRIHDSRLGASEVFHFFWKPSPWNRFVLVHRPDICMPGIGWESVGRPEAVTVDFSGHRVQFYLFRFRRDDMQAAELWGVWRNADAVSLGYERSQIPPPDAAPPGFQLEGKRRSATEIVACVIGGSREHPPDAERAIEILKSVFEYKPVIK